MRGQNALIAMRRAGAIPDWVFIDTEPDWTKQADTWQRDNNTTASLLIEPKDRRLDMRCVTALNCFVQGDSRARVFEVRDACIAVGAKRVIACVMERSGEGEFVTFRAIESTDTTGAFTFKGPTSAEIESWLSS